MHKIKMKQSIKTQKVLPEMRKKRRGFRGQSINRIIISGGGIFVLRRSSVKTKTKTRKEMRRVCG
jgi:hypothetical protein